MKPVSRVLVISSDTAWAEQVVNGMNEAAAQLDNPLGITVLRAADGDSAMAQVLADGEIHVVVIDHGGHAVPPMRGASSTVSTS